MLAKSISSKSYGDHIFQEVRSAADGLLTEHVSCLEQVGLETSLLTALSPQHRDFLPKFSCTAQTCSWDEVESLSACSGCSNWQWPTSSLVPVDDTSFAAVAPPNVTVGAPMDDILFPNVTISPYYSIFDTAADLRMNSVSSSLLRFAAVNHSTNEAATIISGFGKRWQDNTVDYFLCRIHPCVKTFKNVIVRNGAYSFGSQTSRWLILETGQGPQSPYAYRLNDDEAGSASDWVVDFYTATKLSQVLGSMLTTSLAPLNIQYDLASSTMYAAIPSLLYESNLTTVMGALSDVISAEIRSDDNLDVKIQSGVAWEPRTFVVVSWAWMACPLVILAATTATLAMAMIKTSKRLILYKDSAVALLSLGIGHMGSANPDKPVRGDTVGQRYTAYQVETEASALTAKLFKDDMGDYMFLKF